MEALEAAVQPVSKQFKQSVPRANEVVYGQERIRSVPVDALGSLEKDWTINAFDYSDIGKGKSYRFNFSRRSFGPNANSFDASRATNSAVVCDSEGESGESDGDEDDHDEAADGADDSNVVKLPVTKTVILAVSKASRREEV